MIELQLSRKHSQIRRLSDFDASEVKSLAEYIQISSIPDLYGLSDRVVKSLQIRIGHNSLTINSIAKELNHSTRTLQRRLQQQNTNFHQLRDQVRFHYSIDCLIKKNMGIEGISTSMGYTDRTSFTTSFKRWTGFSPDTFRKLYRQ